MAVYCTMKFDAPKLLIVLFFFTLVQPKRRVAAGGGLGDTRDAHLLFVHSGTGIRWVGMDW